MIEELHQREVLLFYKKTELYILIKNYKIKKTKQLNMPRWIIHNKINNMQ